MKAVKVLWLTLISWMLMEGLALSAAEPAAVSALRTLPRSFEGAHLGMSYDQVRATARQIGRIDPTPTRYGTLIVRPKNRHLQRIEYRFYHNVLREMTISYHPGHIPDGYQALLERLKQVYGQPVLEDQEEYDPRPNVFSMRKTVWNDDATTVAFTKSRRFDAEDNDQELILTITDRALQQAYEDEQTREYRQRILNIPIPLADTTGHGKARTQTELSRRD